MIAFTCAFDVDSGESAFQTDYIRSDEVRDEEDISGTQGSCHKTGLSLLETFLNLIVNAACE